MSLKSSKTMNIFPSFFRIEVKPNCHKEYYPNELKKKQLFKTNHQASKILLEMNRPKPLTSVRFFSLRYSARVVTRYSLPMRKPSSSEGWSEWWVSEGTRDLLLSQGSIIPPSFSSSSDSSGFKVSQISWVISFGPKSTGAVKGAGGMRILASFVVSLI